ncbi:DUF4446 family protein [Clostridium sp. DL1XJH146]
MIAIFNSKDALNMIESNLLVFICGMIITILILVLISIIILIRLNKINKRYKKLTRGIEKKSIADIVEKYYEKVEENEERIQYLETETTRLEEKFLNSIQKVSLKRYRAFEDVGSDLSFSLALLDKKDNGVVISSLYNRNESTVYAKAINDGKSKYKLLEEEKDVLQNVLNQ